MCISLVVFEQLVKIYTSNNSMEGKNVEKYSIRSEVLLPCVVSAWLCST